MRARHLIALALMLPVAASANDTQVVQLESSKVVRPQLNTTTLQPTAGEKGSLESRVATLERMLEARNQVQLQVQQDLYQLQQELSALVGSSEEQAYQLNQILNRQRELYRELERLVSNPAAAQGTTAAADKAEVSEADSRSAEEVSAEASKAYEHALGLVLNEKRFAEAIVAFRDFLDQYPESTRRVNAHYWLGHLLYTDRQLDDAHESFMAVVSRYPDSNKRPDSLLKLGLIAKRQGESNSARQWFEQVVSDYPDSSSAKKATSELAKL